MANFVRAVFSSSVLIGAASPIPGLKNPKWFDRGLPQRTGQPKAEAKAEPKAEPAVRAHARGPGFLSTRAVAGVSRVPYPDWLLSSDDEDETPVSRQRVQAAWPQRKSKGGK